MSRSEAKFTCLTSATRIFDEHLRTGPCVLLRLSALAGFSIPAVFCRPIANFSYTTPNRYSNKTNIGFLGFSPELMTLFGPLGNIP